MGRRVARGCGRALLFAAASLGFAWLLILAGAVPNPLASPSWLGERALCLSRIKTLALGTALYQQDYDGTLPAAGAWSDRIRRYGLAQVGSFDCPGTSGGKWGYGMNLALDRAPAETIEDPSRVALLFDIRAEEANAFGGPMDLVYRHHFAGMVACADGHSRRLMAGPRGDTVDWSRPVPRQGKRP